MLRLVLLAATACVAYRIVRENIPRVPRDFDLPGGSPPARAGAVGRAAGPAARQPAAPAAAPVAGADDAATG